MRELFFCCFLSVAAGAAVAAPPGKAELTAGMHLIHAEVVADSASRSRGLMFRKSLGANAGMLFIFDGPGIHCMWMKNTYVPLSVAFIDDDGRIVNIEDMEPQSEVSHCAAEPVRFALEMSRGWFASKGVKPGVRLGGIPPK